MRVRTQTTQAKLKQFDGDDDGVLNDEEFSSIQ